MGDGNNHQCLNRSMFHPAQPLIPLSPMASFGERTVMDSPPHHCCLMVDHFSPSFIWRLVGRDFLKSCIRDKEGWLGIAQVLLARSQPNLDLVDLRRLG